MKAFSLSPTTQEIGKMSQVHSIIEDFVDHVTITEVENPITNQYEKVVYLDGQLVKNIEVSELLIRLKDVFHDR